MANTYFQFKQFTIHQDKCAMKVCTDSCVFGAWIPIPKNTQHILDIGSGTGLLSLMMAQRTNAIIEGIEIENNAYLQSVENFNNSKWSDRLHMHHGNIKDFAFNKKFDLDIDEPAQGAQVDIVLKDDITIMTGNYKVILTFKLEN